MLQQTPSRKHKLRFPSGTIKFIYLSTIRRCFFSSSLYIKTIIRFTLCHFSYLGNALAWNGWEGHALVCPVLCSTLLCYALEWYAVWHTQHGLDCYITTLSAYVKRMFHVTWASFKFYIYFYFYFLFHLPALLRHFFAVVSLLFSNSFLYSTHLF